MTIASKLQLTLDTKAAIKNALITKGAEPTDVFSTYPALIESLATAGIATPQIIAPMDGAVQVSQQPIITATLYFSADPDDTHAASTWEFASDAGFTSILHTSGRDTVNLESYDLSAAGYSFPQDAQVYCRVIYESLSGVEQISPVTGFVAGLAVGAVIGGDIVIGQDSGDWLLVAPASKREVKRWGLRFVDVTELPNNPVPDPNTGTYNTDVLTSASYNSIDDGYGSIGSPAAEYCRSMGYDLPNRQELQMIFDNRATIDAADISGGGNTFSAIDSGLMSGLAWSSTEFDAGYALLQFFTTYPYASAGEWADGNKNGERWTFPVRRIPV